MVFSKLKKLAERLTPRGWNHPAAWPRLRPCARSTILALRAEKRWVAAARILNAISDIRIRDHGLEVRHVAAGRVLFRQAVKHFDLVMPGQRLDTAPTAPAGRPIFDAAGHRHSHLGLKRG